MNHGSSAATAAMSATEATAARARVPNLVGNFLTQHPLAERSVEELQECLERALAHVEREGAVALVLEVSYNYASMHYFMPTGICINTSDIFSPHDCEQIIAFAARHAQLETTARLTQARAAGTFSFKRTACCPGQSSDLNGHFVSNPQHGGANLVFRPKKS